MKTAVCNLKSCNLVLGHSVTPLLQVVLPNWTIGNFRTTWFRERTGLPRWVGAFTFYALIIGGFDWGYRVAERMEDKRGG